MEIPQDIQVELTPDLIAKIQTSSDYDTLRKILEKNPVLTKDFHPIIANHFSGINLTYSGLFYQAHLLFRNALEIVDPSYQLQVYYHQQLHYDLSDLILEIHRVKPNERISKYGFEIDNLKFRFQADMGFYISGFDYNSHDFDFEDVGEDIGKERTLAHIHFNLAMVEQINGKVHTASNCPYLGLFK